MLQSNGYYERWIYKCILYNRSYCTSSSKPDAKIKLTGYPLEMTVQTAQGDMVMKAIKFSKDVPADAFTVGEGLQKLLWKNSKTNGWNVMKTLSKKSRFFN